MLAMTGGFCCGRCCSISMSGVELDVVATFG